METADYNGDFFVTDLLGSDEMCIGNIEALAFALAKPRRKKCLASSSTNALG